MIKERQKRHLRKGGSLFIPQWRMREIRWEESVANSIINREKRKAKLIHFSCSCGSLSCLGVPMIMDI
jgi:hypothetical protein